ncbi:dATP/dGTP pyrophosphohydrolase domain-containing protein [Enterobacter roggenkampii]|uniref:dATP/dGTP pyrophosphohydrolase domain-containing protein n=1 Tax=Enterobacter roggenkampii TaxID=1812935 RepID=UPI003F744E11
MQPRITINIGESASSAQLRRLIRDRHAAWSQETFGDVGPIGPLKHLAKEALEAAAAPDDLSEWADLQFLLWDAQRRAGISDGEITAAMEEKLKVNMARQWPEPKDGEPRIHIKEPDNSPAIPDGYVVVPIEPTEDMIVYGFESEPDEDFSDPATWEEYQAMSGCQQAAHRAKLCWAAMIAAAPKPGDSNG